MNKEFYKRRGAVAHQAHHLSDPAYQQNNPGPEPSSGKPTLSTAAGPPKPTTATTRPKHHRNDTKPTK